MRQLFLISSNMDKGNDIEERQLALKWFRSTDAVYFRFHGFKILGYKVENASHLPLITFH